MKLNGLIIRDSLRGFCKFHAFKTTNYQKEIGKKIKVKQVLVGYYGISTIVGYLMPNPVLPSRLGL